MESHTPQLAAAHDRGSIGYVYLISLVAAVGGLLFGFDTAIISGAIEFVRQRFSLGPHEEGWTTSCLHVGCIFGAMIAFVLSDRFGRRITLIATAGLYAVSAIGAALPRTWPELIVARFAGGLAVGISSVVSPLYIAEIAPARIRGRLVSLNQMAIVSGIFLSYFVNWMLVETGPNNWRYMFGSAAVPAVLLLSALFFVPESPRWLIARGRDDTALGILTRVGGTAHARSEMQEIKTAIAAEQGSLAELFRPGLRIALIIGIMLAVFQQITGINNVIYYGPKILRKAGCSGAALALWDTALIGLTNVLCTLVAIWLIDKIGRKILLLIGAGGMGISLVVTELVLPVHGISTTIKLIPILAYVAFFGIGLGATVWVVIAEIFPTRIRGRAMSIATVSLWIACCAVAQTFPYLFNRYEQKAFRVYSIMCGVMLIFVALLVRETKGKSLEEIERMWHCEGQGQAE